MPPREILSVYFDGLPIINATSNSGIAADIIARQRRRDCGAVCAVLSADGLSIRGIVASSTNRIELIRAEDGDLLLADLRQRTGFLPITWVEVGVGLFL